MTQNARHCAASAFVEQLPEGFGAFFSSGGCGPAMRKVLVGISGASGMPLALRLLGHLSVMPMVDLHCIISDGARKVLAAECQISSHEILCHARQVHQADDLGAGPASGSWWHGGDGEAVMLVVPCSMGTLGALASGATRNLLHRAADVALKEGLRLVLVTRESPLSAIHLRNMLCLREAGAVIMPFSPGFYLRPQSLEAMLDHFCGRILDQARLAHNLGRWLPEADADNTGREIQGEKT